MKKIVTLALVALIATSGVAANSFAAANKEVKKEAKKGEHKKHAKHAKAEAKTETPAADANVNAEVK